jgi:hypothetical protein
MSSRKRGHMEMSSVIDSSTIKRANNQIDNGVNLLSVVITLTDRVECLERQVLFLTSKLNMLQDVRKNCTYIS